MCGRYTITTIDGLVAELEAAIEVEVEPRLAASFEPRYNVAPTQEAPVVVQRGAGRPCLELMRWGLIPPWAKEVSIGAKMINARRETLAEKSAFRDAYARRRCLVPSDGFFEWKREGRLRRPFLYRRVDRRPFLYAGLWERWRAPSQMWTTSFTIITGEPNALVAPLHDRMPVIVDPAGYTRWLQPEPLPPEMVANLLHTPEPEGFELIEVSTRVNSVAHDDPACLAPPAQASLF